MWTEQASNGITRHVAAEDGDKCSYFATLEISAKNYKPHETSP
jgi:hypothetical protein